MVRGGKMRRRRRKLGRKGLGVGATRRDRRLERWRKRDAWWWRGSGQEEGAREEDRPLDEVDEEGERPRPAHSRGVTCGSGSRLVEDGAAWFPPIAGATLGRKKKGKKVKRKKGMPIPKRRRRWKERRERGEARKGGRQERARVSSWSSVPWTTPPEG